MLITLDPLLLLALLPLALLPLALLLPLDPIIPPTPLVPEHSLKSHYYSMVIFPLRTQEFPACQGISLSR